MRIVSLSPAITETLSELGLEDEIVGTTPYCLLFLKERKEIAGSYSMVSIERLKIFRPDIVFLQSHVHDRFYGEVKAQGFNAYLIALPSSIHGIIENLIYIGSITGRYLEAKEAEGKLIRKLESLRRTFNKSMEGRSRIYIEYLWPDWSISTSGSLTFIDDGIWWAGGLNVFYDKIKKFFTPQDEEVRERRPDMVLVSIDHWMKEVTLQEYLERRGLMNLKAAKEGRIKLIRESREINLAHPAPSLIDTMVWLSDLLERGWPDAP